MRIINRLFYRHCPALRASGCERCFAERAVSLGEQLGILFSLVEGLQRRPYPDVWFIVFPLSRMITLLFARMATLFLQCWMRFWIRRPFILTLIFFGNTLWLPFFWSSRTKTERHLFAAYRRDGKACSRMFSQ